LRIRHDCLRSALTGAPVTGDALVRIDGYRLARRYRVRNQVSFIHIT
jgi:hypothetical protein